MIKMEGKKNHLCQFTLILLLELLQLWQTFLWWTFAQADIHQGGHSPRQTAATPFINKHFQKLYNFQQQASCLQLCCCTVFLSNFLTQQANVLRQANVVHLLPFATRISQFLIPKLPHFLLFFGKKKLAKVLLQANVCRQ